MLVINLSRKKSRNNSTIFKFPESAKAFKTVDWLANVQDGERLVNSSDSMDSPEVLLQNTCEIPKKNNIEMSQSYEEMSENDASIIEKFSQTIQEMNVFNKDLDTDPILIKKMKSISSYLTEYFEIFKMTKHCLFELNSKKNAEFNLISKFFDRIRRELDAKEELLKMQYKSMVFTQETDLGLDYNYLLNKWNKLSNILDKYIDVKNHTKESNGR